ncbi:hypothetical protein Hdeb2414_s0023g00641911 [Helianthus debilis subsp. tardiflorus]
MLAIVCSGLQSCPVRHLIGPWPSLLPDVFCLFEGFRSEKSFIADVPDSL